MSHFDFEALVIGQSTPVPYVDQSSELIEKISSISRVNLLVGANNSGKSLMLRHLAGEWNGDVAPSRKYSQARTNYLTSARKLTEHLNAVSRSSNTFSEFTAALNGFHEYDNIKNKDHLISLEITLNDSYQKGNFPRDGGNAHLEFQANSGAPGLLQNALANLRVAKRQSVPDHYYIPALRGLRPPGSPNDVYKIRTSQDYGISDSNIFTGLEMFVTVRQMLLGDLEARRQIAEYERFLSRTFFDKKDVSIIPREFDGNDVLHVKIGNEDERPIHSLGDGIQSVIMLTFLPHTHGGVFYIEEPETHLHPGLQRKFMNFCTAQENAMFFMTTHSNHFLELTADTHNVSVYSVRKTLDATDKASFQFSAVSAGDSETLRLLGVRAASVFLANCTIWVEGISDRWYLRELLQLYQSSSVDIFDFVEDIHFAFVEYGGGNITHWSFLEKEDNPIEVTALCAKLCLVMDHDGGSKAERTADLRRVLGDRLEVLPCRELENALPPYVLTKTILDLCGDSELNLCEVNWEDYRNEKIGSYIDNVLLAGKSTTKTFSADSGTVKSKRSFWDVAIRNMADIDFAEIPEEIQSLVIRLYKFIKTQN